jgi:hypothetical protein
MKNRRMKLYGSAFAPVRTFVFVYNSETFITRRFLTRLFEAVGS